MPFFGEAETTRTCEFPVVTPETLRRLLTDMRIPILALALFSVSSVHSALAQGCTYEYVAFTGQAAPGGGTFYHFDSAHIGANGDIGFIGIDSSNEVYAIYAGRPSALKRIVASGDAIPGGRGATFADFSSVSVSKDGGLGFNAGVSFDGYSRSLWIADPTGEISLGDDSTLNIQETGPASFRSGSIFAKGAFIPGGEESAVQALFGGASGVALESGSVLSGHRVQELYNYYADFDSSVGSKIDANESGKVVFKAAISPTADPTPYPVEAIYSGTPDKPVLIAMAGDSAPGVAASYAHFSPQPSIAADGTLAFSAVLDLGEGSTTGIFSGLPGAIVNKVLEGGIVPTTTSITFGTLSDAVVNSTGDVIFRATIIYPNESTRQGIWIQRRTGSPVLVAISGMTLQTPTGPREVTAVDFAGPGTFDDLHQFLFIAKFGDDEDEGVYIADTRPGAPLVTVTRPRKPREFVTTDTSVKVIGKATDDTGVAKVEYTVTREVRKPGKSAKAKGDKKKFVTSRVRLAKGGKNWSFEVPLTVGLNLISITATDKLGNVSEPYRIRMLRYKTAK